MLQEKAGNIAGLIWNALSASETALTFKQIKKTTKLAGFQPWSWLVAS